MIPYQPTPEDNAALQRCGFKLETAYMEVPRCDACVHWERAPRRRVWGGCSKIAWGEPSGKTPAVIDSPGGLETRADFGCVLWEAKA